MRGNPKNQDLTLKTVVGSGSGCTRTLYEYMCQADSSRKGWITEPQAIIQTERERRTPAFTPKDTKKEDPTLSLGPFPVVAYRAFGGGRIAAVCDDAPFRDWGSPSLVYNLIIWLAGD